MTRPFRFIAPMPLLTPQVDAWRDELRRIEDIGFSSVSISDHVGGGSSMEPLIALAAAAGATKRLRILSLVLNSDLRHPALIHKAAATLDVLSTGRLELGLGAGWMASEYEALGLEFAPAARRVARLAESVEILRRLFAGQDVAFDGEHHRIRGLQGTPLPIQRPHPPFLIAGGGRSVVELAGRLANIAGIAPALSGSRTAAEIRDELRPEQVMQKVAWLHGAARTEGRNPASIELQLNPVIVQLGRTSARTEGWARSLEREFLGDVDLVHDSPYLLIGDVERVADRLLGIRETFGFSYVRLPGDPRSMAPLVRRLAGR